MGDLSTMPIVAELPPAGDYTERAHELFLRLRGATVLACGAPVDPRAVEGGGLVIDYIPEGEETVRRVVFAFTELGMWVEFDGPRGSTS